MLRPFFKKQVMATNKKKPAKNAKAEKATAPQTGKETAENAPFKNNRKGMRRITITAPVAGKYLLPWNIGQTVFHEAKQAAEMIANGDAIDAE
jgi:hypothetical protein